VSKEQAFCVLDQRLSPRRREEDLALLGATSVLTSDGMQVIASGRSVEDGTGLVMLTSGSSGTPKAALLSWDALRASARITQATLRGVEPPVWYPCLPANHIGGLAVLLRALLSDATLVWGDVDDLSAGVSKGATHIAVVRTQLARHDLSGYKTVLLGGARPPEGVPSNVVTTWGMTETGSGIVYDGFALPEVQLSVLDGEVIVKTPTLFSSYRDAPRPSVSGPDGATDWFPTGDAGEINDGKLSIHGRIGFVINTGGEKLWPEDLEAVLMSLDAINDVAVTGVEDPEWGQRVVALVVSNGQKIDDAITSIASERIGPWAKPKEIRYVAAIPRTTNGKIRRSELTYLN
jgi:O-succinylbenzoic acid--CoA ligase